VDEEALLHFFNSSNVKEPRIQKDITLRICRITPKNDKTTISTNINGTLPSASSICFKVSDIDVRNATFKKKEGKKSASYFS